MAIIVAVRSGNWSDTSHVTGPWPGASTPTTKPGVGDTVQAGEFVVEIDEDVHVAMLEATGSGYFAVSNVYPAPQRPNITAAIVNNETANGTLRINNGGTIGNIIGNLTAGDANGAWAVYNGGTIGDITGDLTAGDVDGAWAVYNGGGTIGDITGDLTAGDAGGAWAVYNNSGTIGDINGNLTAGNANSACAVYNNGGGTIGDITGNLTAGDVDGAWAVYSGGTIGDITGDLTAGNANNAFAVYNGGGTIGDITGNLTAGDVDGAYAVYNGGGTIGAIDGSLICGATGQFPIFGPFRLVANPANNVTFCQPNGNPWTLSNDYPAPADVRSGVEYDRGTQTGEMAAGGSIGPVSIVIGGGGIRIF